MPSIRRALPADAAVLVALHRALWADDDGTAGDVADLLARDDFAAFIAFDDSIAIGFAEASLRRYVDGAPDALNGYLEGLYVAPDRRRSGLAARLLDAVAAWARERGATHLGSDSDDENPAGEAWHRARGFDEVGRTINFVKAL